MATTRLSTSGQHPHKCRLLQRHRHFRDMLFYGGYAGINGLRLLPAASRRALGD